MTVSTRYIDTHAHVHCAHFDEDRETVINNAIAEGVERIVEIGYDLPSSRAAIALAEQSPHIYAVVGIQPNHAHEAPSDWLQQVQELAEHPRVVAIGEIGLDYYRDYAPRDMQARFFIEQLQFARQRGLPVVIHTREAWADTVRILQEHARGQPGIMHSFSGNWEVAQACLDVGFLLSFSGPVTFPKARDLHAGRATGAAGPSASRDRQPLSQPPSLPRQAQRTVPRAPGCRAHCFPTRGSHRRSSPCRVDKRTARVSLHREVTTTRACLYILHKQIPSIFVDFVQSECYYMYSCNCNVAVAHSQR